MSYYPKLTVTGVLTAGCLFIGTVMLAFGLARPSNPVDPFQLGFVSAARFYSLVFYSLAGIIFGTGVMVRKLRGESLRDD